MIDQLKTSTNLEYHSDRSRLSSSALKLILKDLPEFHKQYVLNERTQQYKQAFQDGTLLHTLILEPELLEQQYAVYPGMRRQGSKYEQFVAEHPSKSIITASQMINAEKWYKSYTRVPAALKLISGGAAEHTMLGKNLDVSLKARADYINIDMSYIVDVKTTSAPSDPEIFKHTIKEYYYDLSAALYCDLAYQTYGKLFDFYWVVVSKQDCHTRVYKASSNTLSIGAALVVQALVKYKKHLAANCWTEITNNFDEVHDIIEL